MKVIFKKSVHDKILEAKTESIKRMIEINYIELTVYEANALRVDRHIVHLWLVIFLMLVMNLVFME